MSRRYEMVGLVALALAIGGGIVVNETMRGMRAEIRSMQRQIGVLEQRLDGDAQPVILEATLPIGNAGEELELP